MRHDGKGQGPILLEQILRETLFSCRSEARLDHGRNAGR
jgi:hypothetical protein